MSRFTSGYRPVISTRDLDDEELEVMQQELTHWSVPIAQPNEFEANLRPSIFNHLPPLSVGEPAYSDIPRIFDRGGLTKSSPVKETAYSRGVSDSIANNYSPLARSLDVRHLPKPNTNIHPLAFSLPRKQKLSHTMSVPAVLRERTQVVNKLISGNHVPKKQSKLAAEPQNVDEKKLPPIGAGVSPLSRASTVFQTDGETVAMWARNRTGSDFKRVKRKHNDQTLACLAIAFPPWYTSTVGLTRPSTPVDRDLPRFFHLVDNAIDPAVVAPLNDVWIDNILHLVPTRLLDRYQKLADEILNEAKQSYNRAIRISLLNYILLDPVEQKRLGVTAPVKPKVSAEPPNYPWRQNVQRVRSWMQNEFPASMHIVQQIHQHTMTKYAAFRFINMNRFEPDMPMELARFSAKAEQAIVKALQQLNGPWLEECCAIVHAGRDEIERMMPPGLPDLRQAKMDKLFASIASAMSLCLRYFINATLEDLSAWLDQYSKSNSYRGEYNVFSAKFQPIRPVPFLINLNPPMMIDAKRVYTITPGFNAIEEALCALVDKIVDDSQQLPRIEFRLFQMVDGLKVKSIRAVRGWEQSVADIKARITQVVQVNVPGPSRYKATYDEFNFITGDEAETHIAKFLAKPRQLSEIGPEINQFQEITQRTEQLPMSVAFNFYQLDCSIMNAWLTARGKSLSDQLVNFVFERMLSHCQTTCSQYEKIMRRLNTKLETTDDSVSLQAFVENLQSVELTRIKVEHLRKAVEHVIFIYEYRLLEKDHINLITTTSHWPDKIKPVVQQMEQRLALILEQALVSLKNRRKTFTEQIELYAKRLKEFMQRDKLSEAQQVVDELTELNRMMENMQEEKKNINHEELILGCAEITPFNQLVQLQMRKEPYEKLWNLALNYQRSSEQWLNGPITAINAGKVEEEVDTLWRDVYKLLKIFSRNDTKAPFKVAQNVKTKLEKFKTYLPLITTICNPGLKERHWDTIHQKIGIRLALTDEMNLTGVLQQGLEKYLPVLQKVSAQASVEFALEKAIVKMKMDWETLKFEFVPYRNTGVSILTGIDEIQTLLEDHALKTMAIKSSPFIAPFQVEIQQWEETLAKMAAIMGSWVHVQAAWLYLVSIFSSENIRNQMPEEGRMFQEVDIDWRAILQESAVNTQALHVVSQENILEKLKSAELQLTTISRRLDEYLEGKRLFFPQFFFLSNDELLDVLSEILNPIQVQPHLKKCFEGIHRLTFDDDTLIVGMESVDGEKIPFDRKINPENANGLVEVWLQQVEKQMSATLKHQMKLAVEDFATKDRPDWVKSWPGQIVLTVSAIQWTAEVITAINQQSQDHILHLFEKWSSKVDEVIQMLRNPAGEELLTKSLRSTLTSLIILGIHWRDVVGSLAKKNCSSVTDFAWMAQMQYFFVDGLVEVSLIATKLPYGYEYQGNARRLVVTPLTERCHRTLMNAMKLQLGGSLEGPAGTGKSTTVKELSTALAKLCIVFNCSDGVDYTVMARFFKGLARLGAWACFDDFNRINVEVLSVIAQQIQTIQRAVAEQAKQVLFEGTTLALDPTCFMFITLNPSYACRYELPDNLKVLFRPCAMVIPDLQTIVEVSLISMGFENGQSLASKIVVTYKMFAEIFSEQYHYDHGLRGIKRCLVAASHLKLAMPDVPEPEIVLRAIVDANLPKLVPNDLHLFNGILADLFPGTKPCQLTGSNDFQSTVVKLLEKKGHQPVSSFVDRIVQLHEVMQSRHGVIIVGEPLTGKTTACRILASAYEQEPENAKVRYRFINPKAMPLSHLYGRFDSTSHEWIDGVLTRAFREHSRDKTPDRKWIILDGPVDPIWAENLNTVLDDNKSLRLVTGEVIGLSDTQSIIFEVQDLLQASPSTVSRCGIVFMEPSVLGYESMFTSWVASQRFVPEHEQAVFLLAKWLFPACFYYTKGSSHYIRLSQMHLMSSFLRIFEALLLEIRQKNDSDEKDQVEDEDDDIENFSDAAFSNRLAEQKEKELEAQYQGIVCQFLFSLVWSIGATLDHVSRTKFDEFFRDLLDGANANYVKPPALRLQRNFMLPKNGRVYDYFFSAKDQFADWQLWSSQVVPLAAGALGKSGDFTVQTAETVKFTFFLGKLLAQNRPIMLVAQSGTGKTSVINYFLSQLDQTKYTSNSLTLLAKTNVHQLHDIIFPRLKKRDRNTYGPPPGQKMIIFVNDLGMPELDAFGDQPPAEMMRQLIEHGCMYDQKEATRVQVVDTTICASLLPPGGVSREVTPRLLRHFNVITVEPFSDEMIASIFTPILEHHFGRGGFPQSFKTYVPMLIKATLETYKTATTTFLPTPQKCHYFFNLQDFSRVVKGLLLAKNHIFAKADGDGKAKLVRLWVHEVYRVFYDRLADDTDREFFFSTVKDISSRLLNEKFNVIFAHLVKQKGVNVSDDDLRSLMFNGCMVQSEHDDGTDYDEVDDLERALELMEHSVEEYNGGGRVPMPLVMFRFAIEHISRIIRVLQQPGGHCLLIGMGGIGRQSLAKLATYIAGYELYQIEMTKAFSFNEWRKGVKRLLRRAGEEGKKVVFLFSDHQIKEDWFLEDIGVLLNSADIPGIFEGEEKKEILETMQVLASTESHTVDPSQAQLYTLFINRIRQNLHILLTFSPIGETFRSRVRRFPTLVSCCTIDWFRPWPDDAYEMVATRQCETLEMPSNVRSALITMCDKIHKSVVALAEKFFLVNRSQIYVTPTYFLELLKMLKPLVQKRQYDILMAKERYVIGLERIEASGKQIEVMRQELREIPPLLERTTRETNELIAVIQSEAGQVEAKKRLVEADEAEADKSAKEAQTIKEECENALADALPALNAAIAALNTLNSSHITVVKTMQKPPAGVRLVMEAVCVMKGIKPAKFKDENGKVTEDYWPEAKKMLNDMKFVDTLREYNKDNIPSAIIKMIREKYVANPDFDPNVIKNISSACEGLCKWIRAMEQYDRVATAIAPRKRSLKVAEDQLAEQTTKLKAKRAEMKQLEEKLAQLQSNYQAKVEEKQKLEANIGQCHVKIARAEKLISGLGGERERWISMVDELSKTYENIVGDALIAVAIVTYLGAFSFDFRQQCIADWHKTCKSLGIPCSDDFVFSKVLSDPVTLREWYLNGLPVDDFSTENGIITNHASRFPLIIDPQGVANRWIKKMEEPNRLCVVKISDPSYLQTLESCLQFGTPCLLENIGENLDPILEPLLLKTVVKQNAVDYIRIGDHLVEYNKDFRFYMTTRLRSPHFVPEIAIKVTLVNFQITPDALEHQMLGIVVAEERPQLEEKKNSLIVESAANKRRLREIEGRTLEILSTTEGNILEDEEAIELMASSEHLTAKIASEQEAALTTEQEIDRLRNGYIPVARHTSIVYFTVTSLSNINHMYQWRLTWFVRMFIKSVRETPTSDSLDERIKRLNSHFTLSIFQSVSNSLFEKDKLLFPFLLAINLDLKSGKVDPSEWRFLLSGGLGMDNSKNPAPEWMSDKTWLEIVRASSLPGFGNLMDHVRDNRQNWFRFFSNPDPREEDFPQPWNDILTPFQKLIIFRLFRPEKALAGIRKFVVTSLGVDFVETLAADLGKCFEESSSTSPMIFILSPGSDPMATLYKFANGRGITGDRLRIISLGRGQGPIAERTILQASSEGSWVVLQNCHLAPIWLSELERLSETVLSDPEKTSPKFRLWLTTFPTVDFPVSILQSGVKMIDDPPKTLRSNMMKSYTNNPLISDMAWFDSSKRPEVFKKLLYGLVCFHGVVQVRRRFGSLGWNVPYEFNDSDLRISLEQLLAFIDMQPETPPMEAMTYVISECNYGGKVTDEWDTRLLGNLFRKYFCPGVYLEPNYQLTESGASVGVPDSIDFHDYIAAIHQQPRFASPGFFGLNENANTLRHKGEVDTIFQEILLTLPREVAAVGKSHQQTGSKIVADLLVKVPQEFRLEQIQTQFPIRYEEALNGVIVQEIARFNQLLSTIRRSLSELQRVYKGIAVLPIELEEVSESILTGRVPQLWLQKSYPSTRPLGSYLTDLQARYDFFKAWIVDGVPKVFWLASFFFIKSFLAAVLQNHSRKFGLSISDIAFDIEILDPKAQIAKRPEIGAYITGLFLDGASWSSEKQIITEAHPNQLYDPLPIIWFHPGEVVNSSGQPKQVYTCPIYRTTARAKPSMTGQYVTAIQLPINCLERHWINRGVAIVCQLDQ